MSDMEPWTRQLLSVIVSQLCKTIGWHSISTTCLQVLVDVLHRYLKQLGTAVHDYGEHYNHTLPALEELSLALNDMGINVDDLKEYVDYVAPITIKEKVPKYPLEKKSNLNFLKPGSREVVTRPVHIHEYLPAMHPEMSDDYRLAAPSQDGSGVENSSSLPSLSNVVPASGAANAFKKPGDLDMPMAANKHVQRLISEEIGRPLRELSCIMMTTSGFLSPAKEGKAPEARVPKPLSNYSHNINNINANNVAASQPPSHPAASTEAKPEKGEHKKHSHSKSSKSGDHRKNRDDVHHDVGDESRVKKHSSSKEPSKKTAKALHHKSNENQEVVARPPKADKVKMPAAPPTPSPVEPKVAPPKPKPEKMEKVPPPAPVVEKPEMPVEKLPTEPNKSKLNIFKRFTKPKEDRVEPPAAPSPKNQPPDKNAQINECIEAVVKRSREKDERGVPRVPNEQQPPPPSTSSEPKLEARLSPATVASGKDIKRKKKPKAHDLGPSAKRPKLNEETSAPQPASPPPPANVEKTPKPASEPEPPPYSFFTQLQNTPGLMPPSLSSNLLIPRFAPFMNFPKMADPNGPHPEMPNLPLPPATLMQPPAAEPLHKVAPSAAVSATSKKSAPDEKKTEGAAALSDKKLKKKMKKDKKEKEKKKREKKERLKKERLEKKDLKKLKSKKEKLKKKLKSTAAAVAKEEPHAPAEDPSVPKIKLKLNSGGSPQLSPSAGISGTQSPKIVIKPVLKPAEETLNAAASGGPVAVAEAQSAHHRGDGRESSPELAKIAYIGRPPKQKGAAAKSAPPAEAPVAVAAVAPPAKPEPIAPITLLKSGGGGEKTVKIKTKPKEKTKSKKSKGAPAKAKPAGFYYDADGKQVWVCPACGGQDDGTPMIGCDGGCDAWYHWECVGIKSPPNAANWYCKSCVAS